MVIAGEIGRGHMVDARPLLQGAAAGTQGGGPGLQIRFAGGAGPVTFKGGLEFAWGPDPRLAQIGGDGHRKGAPAPGAPSPAVRDCAPPAGGVHGTGRSPGSRVLGPCTTARLPGTTDPTFPDAHAPSGCSAGAEPWAGGSPPIVAGTAADLPARLAHDVPFSPARVGPMHHKDIFVSLK
jgi:hypothetical protein